MMQGDIAGCDPHAAAEMLRALAHPMRLAILCRLLEGEAAVGVFEEELGLRQPSLSQQLAYLREAGIVLTRRISKNVIYRVTDPRVRPIIEVLRSIFATSETVHRPAPPPPGPEIARDTDSARRPMPERVAVCPAGRRPANPACGVFSSAGWPRD